MLRRIQNLRFSDRLLRSCAIGIALILMLPPDGRAQTIIAQTSFEEPTPGGTYTDTGDPSVDHDLTNNPGEAPVDYVSTGGELGFDSRYVNTRESSGLTDGDEVGVTDDAGGSGAFTDGTQGFQLSDTDGLMVTAFDAVDISGTSAPYVGVDVFIADTGYESDDAVRIYATDGVNETDLLNLTDAALEGRGTWEFVQADISGLTAGPVTLIIEVDTNSGAESVYVDNVRFSSDGPLPVELAGFTATANGRSVQLEWVTTSETGNAGFAVEHQAPRRPWASVGFVAGAGTTAETQQYRFSVSGLEAGTHAFRLRQIDVDGDEAISGTRIVRIRPAAALVLEGPNPVSAGADLQITIKADRPEELLVYNVLGQRVKRIRVEAANGGIARVAVSTRDLASGVYFIRLTANENVEVQRFTVVR